MYQVFILSDKRFHFQPYFEKREGTSMYKNVKEKYDVTNCL